MRNNMRGRKRAALLRAGWRLARVAGKGTAGGEVRAHLGTTRPRIWFLRGDARPDRMRLRALLLGLSYACARLPAFPLSCAAMGWDTVAVRSCARVPGEPRAGCESVGVVGGGRDTLLCEKAGCSPLPAPTCSRERRIRDLLLRVSDQVPSL